MTSMERTLHTLGQKEPDQVPLFLLLSMHGAKELGMSIKDYFSKSENVVKGQLLLREKYDNDVIYPFFYGAIEVEAFGSEIIYFDDNPPNAGPPIVTDLKQIDDLEVPDVKNTPCLQKVLDAIKDLKEKVQSDVPIIAVAISPFSLPVMQLGFARYLDLIYYHQEQFAKLMKINSRFCTDWANAQLEAGATAVCYFNPLASPSMIDKETYLKTGYPFDCETLSTIKGPTATHLGSGLSIPIFDELVDSGTFMVGISNLDDISEAKKASAKRLTLIGNLNGLEMINWKTGQAEFEIKNIIKKAGIGGGLIISDNHGEIPWQVSDEVLLEISAAVKKWGKYPLDWI